MNKFKPILALVLTVLCLIVILQNTDSVETKFLFATVTMPRALLLFTTALTGFALGILTSVMWSKKTPS